MTRYLKIALPLSLAVAAVFPQVAAAEEAGVAASTVNAAEFAGKTLYGPKGERIAAIYKVTDAGVPQLILSGKVRSVPVDTLTVADGKLSTSLTKKQLEKGR